jgi:hypothetical protein
MDRKHSEQAQVERLIRLSAASRGRLGVEVAAIKHRFDIPSRIRGALSAHPTTWLFGSMASGMAASLFFRRRPAAKSKLPGGGIFGTLLGLVLTAAKPVAKVWLSQQLARWAAHAASAPPPGRPVPRPLPGSQAP